MRSYTYILILLFIVSGKLADAQQSNALTLQQCIDIAIKNNLNVKQSALTMAQDHINLNQAKENLLPSINGSVSHNINQGRSINPVTNTYSNQSLTSDNYGLSGGITLFNGLALQNNIKQASLYYQAGRMDYLQAKNVVTINIITNYLQILDNEEILAQALSQQQVAQQTVDRSEILEKSGANKTPVDLYNFRGTLASSKVAVVNYRSALEAAKLSLYNLMNIPFDRNAEVQPLNAEEMKGLYGVSVDEIYAAALQQLPVVKAATLRRESAEKALKAVRGYLLPYLSLSANLGTNYSSTAQSSRFIDSISSPTKFYINTPAGKQTVYSTQANYASQNIGYYNQFKNNYGTGIALNLNIPIFNNLQKRNNISTAKINLQILKNIEDNAKLVLQQNVEQAYVNMNSAYTRYHALVEQVDAYKESFRIAQVQFDAGVLTSVDFIIAKNNLDNANLSLISARYDYYIDSKILDYYQGKLSL
ncbi:MAG: TolC family protein [Mucilaginibacter sp.]